MRKFYNELKLSEVQKAAATAAQQKRGLLTFEGRPYYEPAIMKSKTDAILAPLRELVTDAQAMAAEMKAEADRLDAAAHNDPLAGVSNETLQRMALLAPFVKEELAGMYQPNLADRLRGVAQHGDEALQRLYLRYAQPEPGKPGAQDIQKHLDAINEELNGEHRAATAADKEAAEKLRADAINLAFEASRTLAEADGSKEAADAQRRAMAENPYGGGGYVATSVDGVEVIEISR